MLSSYGVPLTRQTEASNRKPDLYWPSDISCAAVRDVRSQQWRYRDSLTTSVSSKGRPYRTFTVDGFDILVGRGDDDNEVLTFEVAEPHDLWLHVAGGTPGSHVIVRVPAGTVRPAP